MDAILTAGGVPGPKEPLYPYTQGGHKALLDIAGKPMIQWVLDALSGSEYVDQIIIVGLPDIHSLSCNKPLKCIENRGGMLDNIFGGIEMIQMDTQHAEAVLVVASDIPAITPEMVNWLVQTVEESANNVFYNVITRQVMETRFPQSKRTYLRLKDMEVCGGDLNAFRLNAFSVENRSWNRLIAARKSPLRQASILGFDTLLYLLLHRLTLRGAETLASKRLGIHGKALLCPFAEIGMDVDKPHQLEILRQHLAARTVV